MGFPAENHLVVILRHAPDMGLGEVLEATSGLRWRLLIVDI